MGMEIHNHVVPKVAWTMCRMLVTLSGVITLLGLIITGSVFLPGLLSNTKASTKTATTPTTAATLPPTTPTSTTSSTTTTSSTSSTTTIPQMPIKSASGKCTYSRPACWKFVELGRCVTCYDILHTYNQTKDCVYELCLRTKHSSVIAVDAYCDMTSGGYTYIHQIVDGSVDFNRNWADYESGFGTAGAESSHWLGLRAMNALTTGCGHSMARIELWTTCEEYGQGFVYEDFSNFSYKLSMSGPSGTAGDGKYNFMNGRPFSTFGKDHDKSGGNCAADKGSGWWYDNCAISKLTGNWYADCGGHSAQGVYWRTWHRFAALQRVAIKVRPPPP